jgi:Nucleotidyl transferase AbiEii toxin, Type IV TA system
MKLGAIYDRGSRKDFVDLFALLECGADLTSLIQLFRTKFPRANIEHLIRSLVYFDRADREGAPTMLWRVSWPGVKRRICDAASGVR